MGEQTTSEEIWVFGGTRISRGKRYYAWWIPGTKPSLELLYAHKGVLLAIGGEYRVKVVRENDEPVSKYSGGTFIGPHSDSNIVALLESKHRAATTLWRTNLIERNTKRASELDSVLEPVCELIKQLSPVERDAFMVYIVRRLNRSW